MLRRRRLLLHRRLFAQLLLNSLPTPVNADARDRAAGQSWLPLPYNSGCIYCVYVQFVIKKWGNGLAIRLPRNSPELGRLEEGVIVEAHLRPVRRTGNWKPATFRGGPRDLSINHDHYRVAAIEERFGPQKTKTPAESHRRRR